MIDIEQDVQRVLRDTEIQRPVLAAPYEISREMGSKLGREGLIAGYIAGTPSKVNDDYVAGWWLDRHSASWRIRRGAGSVLLYLGDASQIGGRMLVAALYAGVARVYYKGSDSIYRHSTVAGMLVARLRQVALGGYITRRIRFGNRTYEQAFDELRLQVGDLLRLPNEDFEQSKAALVLGSLGPGGAERQAAMTAIGLTKGQSWRVVVGCDHLDTPGSDFHLQSLLDAGIDVLQIPSSPELMNQEGVKMVLIWSQRYQHLGFQNIAHIILSYAAFFREQKPALVQTWMDYSNVLAGIAADLVGVPSLVMNGRSVAPDNFSIFQPYMRPGYLDILASRPAILTNNSTAGAQDYERWLGLPMHSVKVINNGFSFPDLPGEKNRRSSRESYSLSPTKQIIGGIMRFSEEKQPYLWVKTAREVLRNYPEAQFVAFGSGVMYEEVVTWVREQGLADQILLPGLVDDAWHALAAMDVFLLTSRMEGLPNVLIEAQAMGVVVVTTGRGGMVESYCEGETGITVPEANPEKLAESIISLLVDPKRLRRMSESGAVHVRDKFSAGRMIGKTEEVFKLASTF